MKQTDIHFALHLAEFFWELELLQTRFLQKIKKNFMFNNLFISHMFTSLGRPRRKWKDNIKKDLQEVGCRGMDWIDLLQDKDR
jgi:hypothetical protein